MTDDGSFVLFPGPERRAQPRYELLAQVRVRHGKVTHVLRVQNISRSGLFVATGSAEKLRRFEIGRRMQLEIFAAGELDNVRVVAEVARVVDRGPVGSLGFGARFIDIDPETEAAIGRMVDKAALRSLPPPPPLPRRDDPEGSP